MKQKRECLKGIFNAESKNSNWEIWHKSKEKIVILHYVPEDDYSLDKDIKIKMSYDHFEDLVGFINKLSRKGFEKKRK